MGLWTLSGRDACLAEEIAEAQAGSLGEEEADTDFWLRDGIRPGGERE